MAKRVNHLKRRRRWLRGGVETWCDKIVEKAAPFWFARTCPDCQQARDDAEAA